MPNSEWMYTHIQMDLLTDQFWEWLQKRIEWKLTYRCAPFNCPHERKEVYAQVCAKIVASIHTLSEKRLLKSWAATIAQNCIADLYNQHRRRSRARPLLEWSSDPCQLLKVVAVSPTRKESEFTEHEIERLHSAIELLPEEERTIIEIYHYECGSTEEKCEKLGITRQKLHKRLRRIYGKLAALLKDISTSP